MLEAVAVAVPVCDVVKFFSSSDSSDIVLFELIDLFFFNLKEVRLNTEPSLTVLPAFELSLKDVLLDNVSISSFGDIPGELNVLEFTLRGVHGDIVFVFVFVLGAELGAELVFVFADGNGLTFEIKGEKLAESSSSESDDCLCIKFVFILAEEVGTVLLELDKSTLETELELEFVYELQVVPDSESELCVDVSTESELP